MPYRDMAGEPLDFAEHNWERLCAISSYLRSAAHWRVTTAQLDVTKDFLCRVACACRAFEEAQAHEDERARQLASGALSCIVSDGVAMAFAETLDMTTALHAMREAVASSPTTPWDLPAALSTTVIGRAVDPRGELTLSQLAVVAALCLKVSDPAFDQIVVSMEHVWSEAYGFNTYDAAGAKRVAFGPRCESWAPSRLVLIFGTSPCHITYFSLASMRRRQDGSVHMYTLHEPTLHELLREQMNVADDEETATLARFVRGLRAAIARGVLPSGRAFARA